EVLAHLGVQLVEHRVGFRRQALMTDVGNRSDDRPPRLAAVAPSAEAFAERVLMREVAAYQRLADHRRRGAVGAVLGGEGPALARVEPQGLQVAGGDD